MNGSMPLGSQYWPNYLTHWAKGRTVKAKTNVDEPGSTLIPEVTAKQKGESFKACKMCSRLRPFSSFLQSTAINKGSIFLVGTIKTSLHLFNHKRDLTDYNCIIGACCSPPSTHSRDWGKSLKLTHKHKSNAMTPSTKTALLFIWYKAWKSSQQVWFISLGLSIRRFFGNLQRTGKGECLFCGGRNYPIRFRAACASSTDSPEPRGLFVNPLTFCILLLIERERERDLKAEVGLEVKWSILKKSLPPV